MIYSGGTTDNATYRNIGDHTEAVEVNNYDDTTQQNYMSEQTVLIQKYKHDDDDDISSTHLY